MGIDRVPQPVLAFLSCSIRPADRPMVDALERHVLAPMGFRCVTLGRSTGRAAPVEEALRELVGGCHCLVGLATERLEARDRETPDRTMALATPYLLQETAMAFQERIPFLIVRQAGVTLPGVLARNQYLEVAPGLSQRGRLVFRSTPATVHATLRDLRAQALRRKGTTDLATLGKVAGFCATAWAGITILDHLSRPSCFGEFYYRDPQCGPCAFRADCKAEKARGRES